MKFNVRVDIKNPEVLPEMVARMGDFRPVFENVMKGWAKENQNKFAKARGQESSGTDVDTATGVHWQGLKSVSIKAKRRKGYPDAIMHATGDLERALTDPAGFWQAMTNLSVGFGAPLASEDQDKIKYNWANRQSIFLGMADMNMIKKNVVDYLSLGEQYKEILFARGMERTSMRGEIASMDMRFNQDFNLGNE